MSISFENTAIAFKYRTDKELKKAQIMFAFMGSSAATSMGISLANFGLKFNLPIKGIIKNTVFSQFCGGETLQEAAATAKVLNQYNVGVALDYGVEGKASEADYDAAVPEFVKAIHYAAEQSNIPFIPIKITAFANFSLLEKMHSQQQLTEEETQHWQKVWQRIDTICKAAYEKNICILIDAEESWIQDPIDDLTNAMMANYNKEKAIVYNTFQMYLHTSLPYLKKSLQIAKEQNFILGAKIVRGAYMEKERQRAIDKGYISPVQLNKQQTDNDYNTAIQFCLDNIDAIHTFIGTHNEESCMKAVAAMQDKGLSPNDFRVYFSQLYGMSDNITFNLADAGYLCCKYLPYGPVKDVMPYLMRRAQENSSVAGQTGRELNLINKEILRRKGAK
jgi:proline dehydrogenase